MLKAIKQQALVVSSLVLTCCMCTYAETLSGTIVDPQQRAIEGAKPLTLVGDGS